MTEINKKGDIFEVNGRKWINADISFDAIAQLNKIILGDQLDADDKADKNLREQVHKDCIELLEEFKK